MLKRNLVPGFTLIEVLIALLVISIAAAAVLKAIHTQILAYHRLQGASVVRWVGMNVVARLQAGIIQTASSVQEGEENMMGKTWYWKATPRDSGNPHILRIDVSVARDKRHLDEGSSIQGFVLIE